MRERERKQDCKIVIIAYTNDKLITPQLAVQTVLLEAECRGQHAASVRPGGVWVFGQARWTKFSNRGKQSTANGGNRL